jgi:hypothetical protein
MERHCLAPRSQSSQRLDRPSRTLRTLREARSRRIPHARRASVCPSYIRHHTSDISDVCCPTYDEKPERLTQRPQRTQRQIRKPSRTLRTLREAHSCRTPHASPFGAQKFVTSVNLIARGRLTVRRLLPIPAQADLSVILSLFTRSVVSVCPTLKLYEMPAESSV